MKKVKFDMKYRQQIESWRYKVVTREGYPVRIERWNMKGNYPILGIVTTKVTNQAGDSWEEQRPFGFNEDGKHSESLPEDKYDLFVLIDGKDTDEFAKELRYWFGQVLCNYDNNGCDSDNMSESAEVYLERAVDRLFIKAKREILKDIPAFKVAKEDLTSSTGFIIKDGERISCNYTVKKGEHYIELKDLLNLPDETAEMID